MELSDFSQGDRVLDRVTKRIGIVARRKRVYLSVRVGKTVVDRRPDQLKPAPLHPAHGPYGLPQVHHAAPQQPRTNARTKRLMTRNGASERNMSLPGSEGKLT